MCIRDRLVGSIALIFLSILLTGLNVYDNIAKHAGAGTLVPITGFANACLLYTSNGRSPGSGEKRLGQRFAGRVPFLSRQRRRFLDVIQPKRRETARVQPPRR